MPDRGYEIAFAATLSGPIQVILAGTLCFTTQLATGKLDCHL